MSRDLEAANRRIETARTLCSPSSDKPGLAYLRDALGTVEDTTAVLDLLEGANDRFAEAARPVVRRLRDRALRAHRHDVNAAAVPLHERATYKPWRGPRLAEAGKSFTPKHGEPGSILYDGEHRYQVWCAAPGGVWAHRDDEPRPMFVKLADCVRADAEQPGLFREADQ